MTLLDLIIKASTAGSSLKTFLENAATKYPDLAPEAQRILEALGAALSQENLVSLAEELPAEIANIAQGRFDGRRHPSDIV